LHGANVVFLCLPLRSGTKKGVIFLNACQFHVSGIPPYTSSTPWIGKKNCMKSCIIIWILPWTVLNHLIGRILPNFYMNDWYLNFPCRISIYKDTRALSTLSLKLDKNRVRGAVSVSPPPPLSSVLRWDTNDRSETSVIN
jgi:hypothetical protein